MGREDLERIERAFAELPEDYREVILLSRLVGLSHREIAEDWGRKEGAIRVLLHRALARLSVLLSHAAGGRIRRLYEGAHGARPTQPQIVVGR